MKELITVHRPWKHFEARMPWVEKMKPENDLPKDDTIDVCLKCKKSECKKGVCALVKRPHSGMKLGRGRPRKRRNEPVER